MAKNNRPVCDSRVRLGDDLAGRLEVPELRIEGASPIRLFSHPR